MAPPSSEDEGKKKLVEEALSSLGSCRAKCSEVLEAARRHRVTDNHLRFLDFLEKELSFVLAGLTELSPQHVNEEMMRWLRGLTSSASYTLPRALDEADPQRDTNDTVLRRAARFFRPRHRRDPVGELQMPAKDFYRLAELRSLHRHLLQAAKDPCRYQLIMLYMSMFPYGYKFEKDQFVMRWLFEGISSFKNFRPSIVQEINRQANTDYYFSYLVDQNVITHAAPNSRRRTNLPDEAKVWQSNVNHLQHQLLATKSAEIGFALTSATLNLLLAPASAAGHGNEASRIPRRLTLHHDDPNIPSLLEEIDPSHTRSLAVSGAVSIGIPLDKFVNLVVLDVEGWENFGDEDLLRVCRSKMFFLEYLSIRNTRVSNIPIEIGRLYSLQVLDASNTRVTEIPFGVFLGIRFLWRLDLRGTAIRQLTLSKQFLELENSLLDLLIGSEGMINSTETSARVPHDILRFRWLEILAIVDLSEQPASFVKALGDLQFLRVLAITWSFHQSSGNDYC